MLKKSLALLALLAIAACSTNGYAGRVAPNGSAIAPAWSRLNRPNVPRLLRTIVGVGDSLTAGYQAGGILGATNFKNPLKSGFVHPGQENGWWADLDEQASGMPISAAIAEMYDPATSPLPLVAAPGLNNQIVPASGLSPIGTSKSGDTCKAYRGFNAAGYLLSGNSVTRMNPNSSTVRNVGVPGITLHEANVMFEPQTNTCEPIPGIPGLLNLIVAGETSTFWPMLGNFAGMGDNLSVANAAASRRPTLATVWLGANDVLKYMGSGGRFVGGDRTVAQVVNDLTVTIQAQQNAGAKVVLLDLPNVFQTPYFMRVDMPGNGTVCNVQTYVYCVLLKLGFAPSLAIPLVEQIGTTYGLNSPGCIPTSTRKPCGYLTLQGALGALAYYLANNGKLPDLDCAGANFTAPCAAGSGIGNYYITPAFAGKVQALNDVVNAGIGTAAVRLSVPLVPVSKIFSGIAGGKKSNPYFLKAVSINPGTCCTLVFGAGLVSFDGLHPSNTGYALIAYYVIQTINKAYNQHIPEIDVRAAYDGTRCSVKTYCFPDPYAPPYFQAASPHAGGTLMAADLAGPDDGPSR